MKSPLQRAQHMRLNPTLAEDRLWQALRNRQVANLKFRRQHPLGPYIADFFCHALNLVVEVDGEIHDLPSQQQKDLNRDAWCAHHHIHVLRFSNQQILLNLPSVLQTIVLFCTPYHAPSPAGRCPATSPPRRT